MSCVHSFTTETGTFTAYPEKVTKSEAEKLCGERGQILAPFTNKEDMLAAIDMFDYNNCHLSNSCHIKELADCQYSSEVIKTYRVGLNFKENADGVFDMTFSNNVKWDDEKHKSLYYVDPDVKMKCPTASFMPYITNTDDVFEIREEFGGCEYQEKLAYMCLKPSNPLVEHQFEQVNLSVNKDIDNLNKDSTTSHKDGNNSKKDVNNVNKHSNKETHLISGIVVTVMIALFFACCAFFFYRKNKRLQEKLSELEGKMKANCIYPEEHLPRVSYHEEQV